MFLDDVVQQIDSKIDSYIFDGYHALVEMLAPALLASITLFITVQGIRIYLGYNNQSIFNFIRHVLMICFVAMLAANWDWFSKLIVDITMNAPDEFIAVLINSDADSMQALFSDLYAQTVDTFNKLSSSAGWNNIWILSIALIGYITNIALMVVIFFLIITAKIALSVLLVLAPMFVPMYFFSSTRQFCWGWIRVMMTMVLIPILLYAVTGLFVDILSQYVSEIANGVNNDAVSSDPVFEYIIIALICVILSKQVPVLAAGISNGSLVESAGDSFSKGTAKILKMMKMEGK